MKKISKVNLLFIVLLILFISGFIYFLIEIKKIKDEIKLISDKPLIIQNSGYEDATKYLSDSLCTNECKKEIEEIVGQAISTVSATKNQTKTTSTTTTSTIQNKTAYISLSGPITTTSTGWVDAVGTDVYIDLASDYSKAAKVTWEAFLKVANGNGQAFARLYDATHGIGVDGSEISLTNIGVSTQVTSGNLNFWAGRNLYRVQIKSLNSFEVTFGSGRIKITY